jgi:methionyl aminopeptidase
MAVSENFPISFVAETDFKPEIWPGYNFTGKLRPATVTPRRTVPAHIPRPDYADHANGESYSEQRAKNSAIIVLNDEQKEGLAVACKVSSQTRNSSYSSKSNTYII